MTRRWSEPLLYAASAAFALAAVWFGLTPHRAWGRMAVVPYAVAAVVFVIVAWVSPRRVDARFRTWVAIVLLTVATLAPMGVQIAQRGADALGHHAQSEVLVVEQATTALLSGENPYDAVFDDEVLARRKAGTQTHFPYLPGMLVLGAVPDGWGPLADARVAFAASTLMIFGLVVIMARRRDRLVRALQVLIVLPTGALILATGGDDLPVLALMLLSLVLLDRRHPVAAGIAIGLAAATKQLAWPLLPFLVFAAVDAEGNSARGRAAAAAGLTMLPFLLPFIVWSPGAFVEDALRFPLGIGQEASAAASPTVGRAISAAIPGAGAVLAVVLPVGLLIGAVVLLVRRPPRDPAHAALAAAAFVGAAVLFAPAARIGIIIYAVNLAVWWWVLRPDAEEVPAAAASLPA